MGLRLVVRLVALGAVALSACLPLQSSGRARPTRGATLSGDAAPAVPAPPWLVRDADMRRSLAAEWRTTLSVQADTLVFEDSLFGAFEGSWGAVLDIGAARVAGVVSRFAQGRAMDSLVVPEGLSVPFAFRAVRAPGAQPTILSPDPGRCDSPASVAMQPFQDLWLELPDALRPGQEWRDSTEYAICRDGIVLTIAAVRRYVVDSARVRAGQVVVPIRRYAETVVSGRGAQFGDSVTVAGVGAGLLTLDVALRGGMLQAGEGEATLELEFRGSRRTQRVTQRTHVVVRAP